ncbi:LysR family transcriptional regulator [Bradyrhizobium sp. 83012]|uniref:LysR family transcriptional regulator n=1 Tax=Bradyrhizobium aeschynomenes TaxID=2734909 RepID=A0ABX2CKR7_9BRAD|nr:LysR family transcriptional regulator [Bradyrhizobium aeschynomenes]NPU10337.1 LysR family transcriptional regulator [Bradyrhizobium aeschynomenes]NPU68792.1 LysR family transcriptional regulator [Bradyrhizobium aeschynomenes]NPV19652.1 LysR family transcriptional regulator [Bradyrhizobium aeschynomenes]
MNWDDLRIVAAVRDAGSYAGAGARLRIDETTVGRRLARIETALGVRLFEAVDGGRRPTPACEMVLAHVEAMASHAADIARVGAAQEGVTGRFRLAATPAVAERILAPRMASLLTAHSGLRLQLLTASSNVSFSRWQADFAIRLRKPEKGDFTITRLGSVRLYLIEPASGPVSFVCAYPDELDGIPEQQILKQRKLFDAARCMTDDVRLMSEVLRGGHAAAVLPEHACRDLLADRTLRVTQLPRRRDIWLLVQTHLKRDPAARVVIDWLRGCFAEFQAGD